MFFFDMVIPTRVGQIDFPASDGGNERFIPTCVGQILRIAFAEELLVRFIPTCVGQMAFGGYHKTTEDGSSPRAWGR